MNWSTDKQSIEAEVCISSASSITKQIRKNLHFQMGSSASNSIHWLIQRCYFWDAQTNRAINLQMANLQFVCILTYTLYYRHEEIDREVLMLVFFLLVHSE